MACMRDLKHVVPQWYHPIWWIMFYSFICILGLLRCDTRMQDLFGTAWWWIRFLLQCWTFFTLPIFRLIDWGSYAHVWLSMKHRMMLCNNLLGVVSWRIWWRSWWVKMCISECVQIFKKSKCFMSILISPLNIFSQNFCSTSLLIIFNIIAGEINNLKVKSLNLVVWVLIIEGNMVKIA